MADLMTQEQVATLELPEGRRLYQRDGIWYAEGDGWGVAAPHVALAKLAAAVANGHLPRPVYDWAMRAYRGQDVPTAEQWEAAERLAAMARNDAHPDSIVTKLANIIDPPKPPPLPEIAACPYCGGECRVYGAGNSWHVECVAGSTAEHVARCYHGPTAPTDRAAIESHNRVEATLKEVGNG